MASVVEGKKWCFEAQSWSGVCSAFTLISSFTYFTHSTTPQHAAFSIHGQLRLGISCREKLKDQPFSWPTKDSGYAAVHQEIGRIARRNLVISLTLALTRLLFVTSRRCQAWKHMETLSRRQAVPVMLQEAACTLHCILALGLKWRFTLRKGSVNLIGRQVEYLGT